MRGKGDFAFSTSACLALLNSCYNLAEKGTNLRKHFIDMENSCNCTLAPTESVFAIWPISINLIKLIRFSGPLGEKGTLSLTQDQERRDEALMSRSCGQIRYSPISHICCGGFVHRKSSFGRTACCGSDLFNSQTQVCKRGIVHSKIEPRNNTSLASWYAMIYAGWCFVGHKLTVLFLVNSLARFSLCLSVKNFFIWVLVLCQSKTFL